MAGWSPLERKAMMNKLGQFYEKYFLASRVENTPQARETARLQAKARIYTLEHNDVVTCSDILRLLSESLQTKDVQLRRNQLVSVFNLMLVHNEDDPNTWPFDALYRLWREVMTGN